MSINLINYALAKKDWEKFYKDLEVLGAGGRNLLRNSGEERISDNENFQSIDYEFAIDPNELLGKTVTFSIEAKTDNGTDRFQFYPRNEGGSWSAVGEFVPTTEYRRYTRTFIFNVEDAQVLRIRHFRGENTGTLYVRNAKLEIGNKATDWTPDPEDINAHPFVAELAETIFRNKQQDWEKAYEDFKVLGVGGRNLIIRSTEEKGTWIDVSGEILPQANHSTSDYIPVKPNTDYMFTKSDSNLVRDGQYGGYFRWAWYDENKNYIGRRADSRNEFLWTTPDNAHYVRISYPDDSYPKFEKGNKATDWTPAPEDIDAHPFVVELAETVFRSRQNEERIRNLENAITALGGGS